MARAQGARAQLALGFESTYGTPPAAGDFWRMPFVSCNLGAEQPLLSSELLGYGRDPLAPVKDAITVDGDVVIPIDARYLGIWLKALFGAPTTTGASAPYTHSFASGGWSCRASPPRSACRTCRTSRCARGCVANSLAFTMNRSGLITATVNVIAQGETVGASSGCRHADRARAHPLRRRDRRVRRNDTALGNIVSAQVSYSNNLDRIETIRNDGMIEGADPSIAALSGTVDVRFADTTLLDQATAGDALRARVRLRASPPARPSR